MGLFKSHSGVRVCHVGGATNGLGSVDVDAASGDWDSVDAALGVVDTKRVRPIAHSEYCDRVCARMPRSNCRDIMMEASVSNFGSGIGEPNIDAYAWALSFQQGSQFVHLALR